MIHQPYIVFGSLQYKVLIWFARNPEEELSTTDIATKFNIREKTCIATRLRNLHNAGILDRRRVKAGQYIWRAGPLLKESIK